MEKQNKYLVWGVLSLIIPLLLYIFVPRPKTEVLSENISQTPLVLPEPSAQAETASPTLSPTPIPTKTPEPLPTPTPVPPAEINALIDRFSAQYGVDPNVMRHIAICESGFNPLAIQGAYVGLFQFGPITWKNIRREIGEDANLNLRFSAEESSQTAAYALSQGKRAIWPHCAP